MAEGGKTNLQTAGKRIVSADMKCVRVKYWLAVAAGAAWMASGAEAAEPAPEGAADPVALPSSALSAREDPAALLFAGRAAYEDSLHAIALRRFALVRNSPAATGAQKAEAALWTARCALAMGDLDGARAAWEDSEGADPKERALEAYRIAEAAGDWDAAQAALAPFATPPEAAVPKPEAAGAKPATDAKAPAAGAKPAAAEPPPATGAKAPAPDAKAPAVQPATADAKKTPPAPEAGESETDRLIRRAKLRSMEARGEFAAALAALPPLAADGTGGLAERFDYAEALAQSGRAADAVAFLSELEASAKTPEARERTFLERRRIQEQAGMEETAPAAEGTSPAPAGETPAMAMERAKAEAETLAGRGAYEEAVSRLEAALALPLPARDANALKRFAGEMELRRGDIAAGARRIREAIAEIPDAGTARATHLRLAERLMKLGAYEEAEAEYRIHRGAYPDDAQAAKGEAEALAAQGKWAAAAARWEAAGAWKEAGEARFRAGDYAKAAEDFRSQAAEMPDGPGKQAAAFREAKCLDAAGEKKAARAAYEAIAADARNPHAPAAALQQALLTAQGGEAEKALELLAALSDAPDAGEDIRREALLAHGKLLESTGETEAAYADFARLAAGGAQDIAEEADYRAARCLLALGLSDEGLKRLDAFVRAHPASRFRGEAKFVLAAAAYNAGEYPKAERLFITLTNDLSGTDEKAEALFWAGKAAATANAGLKANGYLNDLLKMEGVDGELLAEALLLQGDVLSRLGHFAAAIVAFDEVIARFPQTRQAAEARGRKGDCQYTLAENDPARFEEALLSYRTLAGETEAADDLRLQAMYKVARTMERQGLAAAALDHYLEAVYAFLQLADATPEAAAWFTRAAYAAAAAKEAAGDWKGAAGIYERVAGAGVPASEDAKAKKEALERTHWF